MFEKHIICPMLEYMKKAPDNFAFIDVGGNVGAWTIAIAASFPHIPVLTVEPLPPNAELLRWSLSENKMSSEIFEFEFKKYLEELENAK